MIASISLREREPAPIAKKEQAMSFRDNLQHLRASRNMTQEQLAMLVGVSRQSVTKWEAERAYPEMDKLLKLCQIFDCSLDDLVSGDLTTREADAAAPEVPSGPATDVCGYDEQARRFALRVPTGISLFILALAGSGFVDWAVSGSSNGDYLASLGFISGVDALPAIPLFVFVAAGLAFVIPAGLDWSDFRRTHPYIEDFYTEEDRAATRRVLSISLVVGIGLVLIGILPGALNEGGPLEDLGGSLMLAIWAVGVWFIVYGSMMANRLDIAGYNKDSLEGADEDDLDSSKLSPEQKERVRAYRNSERGRRSRHVGRLSGLIMLIATVLALLMLFGGLATGANVGSFFWIPWPIGGLLCAIVSVAVDMRSSE